MQAFAPWVTSLTPNSKARLRLFCFPYAGGGVQAFRKWPDDLPETVDVCPIQLPGRGTRFRETPFDRLVPLVQAIAQGLLPHLDEPFAFFGHSLGALIGFELTRQLRRQNDLSPVHLFVSGCRAPQIPDPDPPIHQLPDQEFVAQLRRFNGTPEAVLQNTELMQLLLPVLRTDFAIVETYVYATEEPLDCPISAFGGLQDDEIVHKDLVSWREQTCSSFTLRMFPGDHFFLHSARTLLVQAVSQDLTWLLSQ